MLGCLLREGNTKFRETRYVNTQWPTVKDGSDDWTATDVSDNWTTVTDVSGDWTTVIDGSDDWLETVPENHVTHRRYHRLDHPSAAAPVGYLRSDSMIEIDY